MYGARRAMGKLHELTKQNSYNTSKYVGILTWGLYGINERMEKKAFEKSVMVEFEGKKYPTFSCWDSYLNNLYGDYMKIPPIEKRKIHDAEIYIDD